MRRPSTRPTLTRFLATVVVLAAACGDQRLSTPTSPTSPGASFVRSESDSEAPALGTMASGPLASLSIDPSVFKGGSTTQGTVTLVNPAPAGGLVVSLSSDETAATVPGSITIAAGATRGVFAISTKEVSSDLRIRITASASDGTLTALMRLTPLNPLASLTADPQIQRGGDSIEGTVTLASAAQAGGTVVNLESEVQDAIVPATVTIAAGAKSATFTIETRGVSQPTEIWIHATLSGGRQSVQLRLTPGRPLSTSGTVTIGARID